MEKSEEMCGKEREEMGKRGEGSGGVGEKGKWYAPP